MNSHPFTGTPPMRRRSPAAGQRKSVSFPIQYLSLTGDVERELARVREAYAGKAGKHPEQAGAIRLGEERIT